MFEQFSFQFVFNQLIFCWTKFKMSLLQRDPTTWETYYCQHTQTHKTLIQIFYCQLIKPPNIEVSKVLIEASLGLHKSLVRFCHITGLQIGWFILFMTYLWTTLWKKVGMKTFFWFRKIIFFWKGTNEIPYIFLEC